MLGVLVVVGTVLAGAGCGTPDAAPGGSGSGSAGPVVGDSRVAVVSLTGARAGGLAAHATALPDARAQRSYLARLPTGPRAQARRAIEGLAVTAPERLYAQVVHVGCREAPADTVSVVRRGSAVTMTSSFREPATVDCFAPVSTLAFAAVPG